jgi:hypothetical protein
MAATIMKVEFEALASTREEVLDKLEEACNAVIIAQGGEPWIVIKDEIQMRAVSVESLMSGDPSAYFYQGTRSCLFTGPTKVGPKVDYHDGFRPQAGTE